MMKRTVKALVEGCVLEGKDGKELEIKMGQVKELSLAEWKNFSESVRGKIGVGSVYYKQMANVMPEAKSAPVAPKPVAKVEAKPEVKAKPVAKK